MFILPKQFEMIYTFLNMIYSAYVNCNFHIISCKVYESRNASKFNHGRNILLARIHLLCSKFIDYFVLAPQISKNVRFCRSPLPISTIRFCALMHFNFELVIQESSPRTLVHIHLEARGKSLLELWVTTFLPN